MKTVDEHPALSQNVSPDSCAFYADGQHRCEYSDRCRCGFAVQASDVQQQPKPWVLTVGSHREAQEAGLLYGNLDPGRKLVIRVKPQSTAERVRRPQL